MMRRGLLFVEQSQYQVRGAMGQVTGHGHWSLAECIVDVPGKRFCDRLLWRR